jgi:hypothetical protein
LAPWFVGRAGSAKSLSKAALGYDVVLVPRDPALRLRDPAAAEAPLSAKMHGR